MTELEFLPRPGTDDDDDEDFVDETIAERLWGLTEMFPDSLRSTSSKVAEFSWNGTKVGLSFSRNALWMIASTFTLLVLPVLFEKERAAMQEQQLQHQRQILLGPSAAVSGGQQGMAQNMMGMMPPAPPGLPQPGQ